MYEIQCPACDEKINHEEWRQEYVAPFNNQTYKLYRCHYCCLEFWIPLKMVPEFYANEGFTAYSDFHKGIRQFHRWTLPFFDRLPIRDGKLLDVGCGDGAFLSRAKSLGFDTFGIDIDRNSVKVAKEKYNLNNVSVSTLEEFLKSAQDKKLRFDVLSFFEVLEHQDNPRRFLDDVKAFIKPGGYVVGSVPNRSRFLVRLDRIVGDGDFPPHHFLWFSRKVLESFLRDMHFESVYVIRCGNLSLSELLDKLLVLVGRKLNIPGGKSVSKKIIRLILLPSAIILWFGLWVFPPNLYFQAKTRAG